MMEKSQDPESGGGTGAQNIKSYIKRMMKKQLKDNLLLGFTILAVILGVATGFILRSYAHLNPAQKLYFGFLGEIFLRLLKFLIIPLVASSIIAGVASLGTANKTGKVASIALIYYLTTTVMAAILGILLVVTIQPGNRVSSHLTNQTRVDVLNGRKINPVDTILDLIRNLFPDNIVQMTFVQYETKLVPKFINEPAVASAEPDYWMPVANERHGLNVLGLVMFCLVFGFILSKIDQHRGRLLIEIIEAINESSVKGIGLLMMFSPIGIWSLICSAVLNMDDPRAVFAKISYYAMTVLIGLFVHGVIVLPLIFVITTRRNVFKYMKNMLEAFVVALATSSSNATLPITFKCIEVKNRIPKSISRFVIPVGATINMDGTALYEAIAAIFIAQLNNMTLSPVDYIVTSITATLASIGAAGVPSAGLVTMVIVLSALNLPQTEISLIYAVDWFLDRFRTVVNVWGDSVGAGVVAHLSEMSNQDLISHFFVCKSRVNNVEPGGQLENPAYIPEDPSEMQQQPRKASNTGDETNF